MLALPLYDDTPKSSPPVMTLTLIGTCAAVFLWQLGLPPRQQNAYAFALGIVPSVLFGHAQLAHGLALVPPWATIFTSMFMHGGWLHILGNMLYLWLFGKGVESALGPARFLIFYLVCGVIAALTQALIDPLSDVPIIGASGAIAGVLGAYLVLHPRGHVVVLFWLFIFVRLIAVPAVILLGLWFLIQLASALDATQGEAGVAFWAHVGGFIAGMILVPLFRRRGVQLFQPPRSVSFRAVPRRGPWG